jgi:DNA-directed RNA polymerase specialized sigma24 family protein
VQRFGCNKDTAEDLVQEMYIKIKRKLDEGVDIMFSETEVNYYYIFKTLNTLFLDLKKKEKNIYFENLDDVQVQVDDKVNYATMYALVQEELSNFHWYDQKVYELIEGGESSQSLSDKTNIGYHSLRNTYIKVKKKIKKKLNL